jgi:transcriptional regulator with XRE-family HTH domain
MRDSASGPVAIPPDFWSRPDVIHALADRDIGKLFRLLTKWTGLSQNRIGVATGLGQGRVSYIINDKYKVRTIKSLARIADGLNMPGPARAALGLASDPGGLDVTPPARVTPDARQHSVASPEFPATTEQAVIAATGLWHADAARSKEALSAPLDPAAWNAAALA